MVFDILIFVIVLLMKFDFEDRGVISNSRYSWGVANYFYFIGIAITFVGAMWLLITKNKAKKMIITAMEGDMK